jgi:hypothetical protein
MAAIHCHVEQRKRASSPMKLGLDGDFISLPA